MERLSKFCQPFWRRRGISGIILAAVVALSLPALEARAAQQTFSQNEILQAAENFFGVATKGLAEVIQKVFDDLGDPNAFIVGEEISGAFIVGLRYGRGELNLKGKPAREVFWQGPSIGFDFGGNASKAFVLIYNLPMAEDIFRRFPGVDGSFYLVAGVGVNYQTDGGTTLAPIRTGVGLRAGASLGYLHYTSESSWLPF